MQLTRYTDYGLRVLLYLGARDGAQVSISAIATAHGISHNHLMKVVQELVRTGFVASARGRYGGVRLARPPAEINIGAVLRALENFQLADCGGCALRGGCALSGVFGEAVAAFLAVLDRYSLQDLIDRSAEMGPMLAMFGKEALPPP